jgi:hypothetical protein
MEHDRPVEECHRTHPAQGASTETCEKNFSAKENRPPSTTSPAKVAANRRNAQKSTGPRTPEGKARSRWNAVQHGLLAKRLLAPETTDGDAWTHLLESLREDWHPEGTLEEILLERIAMGYRRLHTVYAYEVDFARSAQEFFGSIDRTGRYATSINRQLTQDLNQLERLQRQRKGEFVPAPIALDVTVNGPNPGNDAVVTDGGGASLATVAPVPVDRECPNPLRPAESALEETSSSTVPSSHEALFELGTSDSKPLLEMTPDGVGAVLREREEG